MLFKRFILGELLTNCYIVSNEDTKNTILFDAPADAEKILEYLTKNDLTLSHIFLTHAHFDHILALEKIKNITGAKLFLHKEEAKYLEDPELNLSGEHNLRFDSNIWNGLLNDGDEVLVDGIKIRVIHTPGHTVGSVCYLLDDILISGDTLFSGSIGRSDFPLGDFDTEISSIKEKLLVLDDDIKVYPGHGFSTTIGKQRKENPYLI